MSEQATAITGIAALHTLRTPGGLAIDFLRDPEANEFCLLRPS